ncbi:O-antigen polysaccharide polymerase Wzy [Chryseobacterium sp. C-71]|uniref:O-antigen polysaccharide polymerase Wzy n=1 Tax=Chryseobacterium sp. C-71 TaxID=2893882 RepID=UPI001E284507|nr:O-antigen polysaccharide polymerase Wzy [Chryseobacterium sp. C-71]UFH33337.1 O-antigen polysaccharide polymerase Wzy [Chryseobacterium sp. C-71]
MLEFYVIILLVLISINLVYINKKIEIHNLLKIFITIAFVMWYFIPITLTLLGYTIVFDFLKIDMNFYYKLLIKELIFYNAILLLFTILFRKRKINFTNYRVIYYKENIRDIFFFRFSFIFLIIYIIFLVKNNLDYMENNSIENQQGGVLQVLAFFSNFLVAYFWVYFLYGADEKRKKWIGSVLITLSIVLVLGGSRIYLLGLIYVLYFIYKREEKKAKKVAISVFTAVFLVFSIVLLPYLSSSRVSDSDVSIKQNDVFNLALEEFNTKLNSFAYSTALLKYDGEEFAGFNPYLGSLLKFIPRVVWNEKPTATSFNSEVSGIPSRRVPYLLGDTSETFNTGVSAYAVSAWQMGIFTVVVSIVFNVVMLFFINRCFMHRSVYIKSLGFMMTGFPQLIMLPTYGDNIIQWAIQTMMFFLGLLFLRIIIIKKKSQNKYENNSF